MLLSPVMAMSFNSVNQTEEAHVAEDEPEDDITPPMLVEGRVEAPSTEHDKQGENEVAVSSLEIQRRGISCLLPWRSH